MADRDEIVGFCDELLEVDRFRDYGPNGLQVPGTADVRTLVTGVSAHLELIERAIAAGADMVIAHHGLFWEFHPRALSAQMKERLKALFEADVSLCGYHLPLDAHPRVGNNALLCAALGFEVTGEPFGEARGQQIGVVGRLEEGLAAEELRRAVTDVLAREPLTFDAGPELVRSLGVLTGAGASAIGEAVALGLDAMVTGEPAEHVMADAREGGVHLIAAGHYATETLGVRRLGELVAERFGIDHAFIDVPNPV